MAFRPIKDNIIRCFSGQLFAKSVYRKGIGQRLQRRRLSEVVGVLLVLIAQSPYTLAGDFPDGTSDFEIFRARALDDLTEALESGSRTTMERSLRVALTNFRQDFPHLDQSPDPEEEQIDVASLETVSLTGERLVGCDEVRYRFEMASQIADQVIMISRDLLDLLETGDTSPEAGEAILQKTQEISGLRSRFREVYPDSLQIQDRTLLYNWSVTPVYNLAELKPFRKYVDSWIWDGSESGFKEIHFAHFSWHRSDGPFSFQPQADEEPGLFDGAFRLSRLASPVMACLGDQSVFARATATVSFVLSPPKWICLAGILSCRGGKHYGRETIKFALIGNSRTGSSE